MRGAFLSALRINKRKKKMGNKEMQRFTEQTLKIWDSPEKVKALFAPSLNKDEFSFFMGLGIELKANPFTREIWAVKYGTAAASIFCGRDFYRRKAQELEEYDGHCVDSVYSNDTFSVEDGKPKHTYSLSDRGVLLGAYSFVKNKTTSQPYYVFVKLSEYDKKQSNWKNMPDTMIKKVAEAQGLRGAFQGTFKGTYDESEQSAIEVSCDHEPGTIVMPKSTDPETESATVVEEAEVAQKAPEAQQSNAGSYSCSICNVNISKKVSDFSISKFKQPLCMPCQKGEK